MVILSSSGAKATFNVRHGCVIFGHADIVKRNNLSVKALEFGVDECSGYLSCAVGAEIEENKGIILVYSLIVPRERWEHKFIGDELSVLVLGNIGFFKEPQRHSRP